MAMEAHKLSRSTPTDAAFAHSTGIYIEVAVELLGQKIARLSAAIEEEEDPAHLPGRRHALNQKRTAVRRRQQGLRSENVAAVEAVFGPYGRGRK